MVDESKPVKELEELTQQKPLLSENPTEYEATLIKAWRHDGYKDEQIAEFLKML